MSVPVISVAQMREWEKVTWASGQTEAAVIRQAGQAVGRHAERWLRAGERALVLAGKGHNGDDAKEAAGHLEQTGHRVEVLAVHEPQRTKEALEEALARKPSLIIDGLFGIGLSRPLAGAWVDLIRQINRTGIAVLAVDVPSGLNAATGLPQPEAIRAACTVTLGAVKEGLLRAEAWPFVGRLEVAREIGLAPYEVTTELGYAAREDFEGFPPRRAMAAHKGSFGHLVIVAGSLGYHGASVLAARGAQRAQPGLITVMTSPSVYTAVAAQLQSTMVRPWEDELEFPKTCTAVLAGPGLASPEVPAGLKAALARLWRESPLAMVVDASALGWLAEGECPAGALRVLTPHPGEAARLLQRTSAAVQQNRPAAVRELSRRFGNCLVVLKGHQTVTGRDTGQLLVNSSGNPYLAQGGSGDLLGGYLAGLVAQPELQGEAAKTVSFAVWQHGAAADELQGRRGSWTVEDLADILGKC